MTLAESLEKLLPPDSTLRFGEIQLSRSAEGTFRAVHVRNRDSIESLEKLESLADLREMAKFDANNAYRPLKTAPTLKCGWITECNEPREFIKRLDAIYPGLFATWVAYDAGELDPVALRTTLDRQTGMYRFAGTINDQMANQIMREVCSPGCIRKIAWPIDNQCAVGRVKPHKRFIPPVCTEACTFAVSKARELVKKAYDKANAPEQG